MDKNLKDITYFISFCIEQYMNEKGINEDEVISIFSEYGVFDYLKDYFDVLHTQSRQWLVADIEEFINDRKNKHMILYHGSIEIVENPEIRIPSRSLDYGSGFYTTTSFKQAEDWVKRKLNANTSIGYVNVYELDETLIKSLNAMLLNHQRKSGLIL